MDDDTKAVLRTLGWVPTGLGVTAVAFGAFYYWAEWRFAGAFLFWSLMWGLMLKGLGLVVMATGRRWLVLCGLVECLISALLVYAWERQWSLGWGAWIYAGDALAVVLALPAFARSRRPRRAPPSAGRE